MSAGRELPVTKICAGCGRPLYTTIRADSRFCVGGACKQRAWRRRRFQRELLVEGIAGKVRGTPPERLRGALAELRSRGEPFDEAWPTALVVAGGGGEWQATFADQRHVWLAEFERRASTSPLAARAPTEHHPVPRHLPGRLAA